MTHDPQTVERIARAIFPAVFDQTNDDFTLEQEAARKSAIRALEAMTPSTTEEQLSALRNARGGRTTLAGTAENLLFEQMSEKGWVKVVDIDDVDTVWKLSGEGLRLAYGQTEQEVKTEWRSINLATPRNEDETFLVWCPGLKVSGPWVVAYFQNDEWKAAITGARLTPQPTHCMPLPKPPQ